ncbi:MAG: glycosyltransferase [bacterium]
MRHAGREPLYAVVPSSNGEPTCRTHNRWIHDPHQPVSQAASAVQSLGLTGQTLVLVFRAGLGYLAMDLAGALVVSSPQTRILIHEDRWDLVWESLTRLDWSGLISHPSVLLCVGDKADDEIGNLLKKHPSLLLNGLRVVPGSNLDDEGNLRLRNLAAKLESIATQGRQRLLALGQIQQGGSEKRTERESIVLYGRVFEDQLEGFKRGLERNNAQVSLIERSRPMSEFVSGRISWIETCGCCPDIAASFNRSGFEPVELEEMGAAGVRRILWFYDNPQRFDLDAGNLSHVDLILVFDPHHAASVRSITNKPVDCLRTATSFWEEPKAPRPARCSALPKVSFVGSSGLRRMQGFAYAMQTVLVPFRSMIEDLVKRWRGRDAFRLHEELESLPVQCPGLSPGSLLRFLEEYASMYLRLEFLRVAEPYGLMLFGDPGWTNTEIPGTVPSAYAGWAPDYWTETPWIYRNSLINLNIFNVQCIDSPTIRVYDILACGGFLLTEYRPCLEEEFAVGEDLETFRTPEELREKIEYYLANESLRRQIARRGQIKVLENYTYVQRGREFLQRARSLL